MQQYPASATIVEVGPRDGLQNEKTPLVVEDKVSLIDSLSQTGLTHIEAGSFVSPKWVPQMANSDEVFSNIKRYPNVVYSALTPNIKGIESALAANVNSVAIFGAASELFSQKNINCSIEESLNRFDGVMAEARRNSIPVRGYVSCILGCPYQGDVSADAVLDVTIQLLEMGCYEVSLGDTIGVGTPAKTDALLHLLLSRISADKLAMHMHDTYGQALANVLVGLENGIATFDSSVAGLGGCPYANGASGNLATEDLVYMLTNMDIETGVNLDSLVTVGDAISQKLGRDNMSKAGKAIIAKSKA